MLKQIPGSERMGGVEEEEDGALSSIARFEKLMKEQEEKKRAFARASARPGEVRSRQQPPQAQARQPSRGGRKNWGVPDAGEESDIDPALPNSRAARRSQQATPVPANPNANFYIDSNDSTDDLHLQHITAIPPPAQRALEFISGRTTPTHPSPGHPSRPTSRSISQANLGPRPPPPPMPRMASTGHASKGRPSPVNYSLPPGVQREGLKPSTSETHLSAAIATRRTSSNSHRLSFTEFTKRLSSEASSLLLVQTNTSGHSGGSKRNSHVSVLSSEGSIYEGEEETDMRRGTRLSVSGASGQAWKGYNMNAIQTQMSQVQLSNTQPQRPGMGARRSTVATEGRESWRDSSAKCGSGWRGNGVNFGDGGFL